MKHTISKPRPSPISSGRTSPMPSIQINSDSPRRSSMSSISQIISGPSSRANGPSQCQPTCNSLSPAINGTNAPQRPPRPDEPTAATQSELYQAPPMRASSSPAQPNSPPATPAKPTVLRRLSTATTLHKHLSIAGSTTVLPFSNRRRPSIPIEDFPTSPEEDDWEDFSFEEDIAPVSPTRVIRRKSSIPLSPRLTRGASLSRSNAARRTRKSRSNLNYRGPATPIDANRPLSVYSEYSFYSPSQIDDQEDFGNVTDSSGPASSFMSTDFDESTDLEDLNEFSDVPRGNNLEPRGSVSSIATVRPPLDQRNPSRLGGLKDKLRCQWLANRPGPDESSHNRSASDVSLSSSSPPSRPAYNHSRTNSGRPVFKRPGFRSFSKPSQTSGDFRPGHGYQSSTDSSSYAPSFSSFERNVRLGGKSGSSSCGDDWTSEDDYRNNGKPLPASRASSIISPAPPSHSRNNSSVYAHLRRPDSVTFVEPVRKPKLRMKNGVPHHSCNPERVPYPLSYSANMMEADRWNHMLLFGDDRNPANGGLLRGSTSTVSFSQFYGVGSGKKEVLNGRELRGGKVLDLGCGEGLWVLAAAKEWRHTRFVGFDLLPIQMDLEEKLDGARNAQDIIDRIEWAQGDFLNEDLPFADNSFDLVRLANTTLALPTDAGAANSRLRSLFSEIFRVLKVNGEFEIIDENHTVPSASKASPACPENPAFEPHTGTQMRQLEQAFARMLQHHQLTAYNAIPGLLQQHFSTSSEKANFRLAVSPDPNAIRSLRARDGMEQVANRVEMDRDLGLVEDRPEAPAHGRSSSFQSRNRKMLQLLGKEYAEVRKPTVPQGLIVLPNRILPMPPVAVYAHATHSTNVLLNAKEQLFNFVEYCAQGRAVADRGEFDDLLWDYEASRFGRLGLRDPLQSYKDWETGIFDVDDGSWSGEQRSPRFASSPPPDAPRTVSLGPLPSWRYESDSNVVTVREIRVCLARKLSPNPPFVTSN